MNINLDKIAVATGGTLVVAESSGKVSSLAKSQFKRTVRDLKKLGYNFGDDRLVYHQIGDAPKQLLSYSFVFTKGTDRLGLNVLVGDAEITLTAALFTGGSNRITSKTKWKVFGDLDSGVAKHAPALLDNLMAKATNS